MEQYRNLLIANLKSNYNSRCKIQFLFYKDKPLDFEKSYIDINFEYTEEGSKKSIKASELAKIPYKENKFRILIEGKMGEGKSTLCKYIAYQWTTNQNSLWQSKFNWLFWINLREIKNITFEKTDNNINNLIKLLKEVCFDFDKLKNFPEDFLRGILEKEQDKILWLLDGYDEFLLEYNLFLQQTWKIITHRERNIILTSLNGFRQYLNNDRLDFSFYLELSTFNSENSHKFIEVFFHNTNNNKPKEQKKLIKKVKRFIDEVFSAYDFVSSFIYLEIFCTACNNLEGLKKIKKSNLNEIMSVFNNKIIYRYIKEGLGSKPILDTTVTREKYKELYDIQFLWLEYVAFKMIKESKHIFTEKDLDDSLDVVKTKLEERKLTPEEFYNSVQKMGFIKFFDNFYKAEFHHSIFREYFAACYMVDNIQKQDVILDDSRVSPIFWMLVFQKLNNSADKLGKAQSIISKVNATNLSYNIFFGLRAVIFQSSKLNIYTFPENDFTFDIVNIYYNFKFPPKTKNNKLDVGIKNLVYGAIDSLLKTDLSDENNRVSTILQCFFHCKDFFLNISETIKISFLETKLHWRIKAWLICIVSVNLGKDLIFSPWLDLLILNLNISELTWLISKILGNFNLTGVVTSPKYKKYLALINDKVFSELLLENTDVVELLDKVDNLPNVFFHISVLATAAISGKISFEFELNSELKHLDIKFSNQKTFSTIRCHIDEHLLKKFEPILQKSDKKEILEEIFKLSYPPYLSMYYTWDVLTNSRGEGKSIKHVSLIKTCPIKSKMLAEESLVIDNDVNLLHCTASVTPTTSTTVRHSEKPLSALFPITTNSKEKPMAENTKYVQDSLPNEDDKTQNKKPILSLNSLQEVLFTQPTEEQQTVLNILLNKQKTLTQQSQDIQTLLTKNRTLAVEVDRYHNTLTHYAAFYGRSDLIDILLKANQGAASDQNEFGLQALHIAAFLGHQAIVNQLLSDYGQAQTIDLELAYGVQKFYTKKASKQIAFKIQCSTLGFAVLGGQVDVVENLLTQLKNKSSTLIDKEILIDGLGNILHLAVLSRHGLVLQKLLHHDFIITREHLYNQENQHHLTPLSLAVTIHNQNAIHLLASHAKVKLKQESSDRNRTVLHTAVKACNLDAIEIVMNLLSDGHNALELLNLKDKPKRSDLKRRTAHDLAVAIIDACKQREETKNSKQYTLIAKVLNGFDLTSWQQLRQKPSIRRPRIRNLVFQGGGPRGIAFIQAIRVLGVKLSDGGWSLGAIERVCGSSAGAITAGALALGYNADGLLDKLGGLDLSTLLDMDNGKDLTSYINQLKQASAPSPSSSTTSTPSNFYATTIWHVLKDISDVGVTDLLLRRQQLWEKFQQLEGLCKGKVFLDWFNEHIIATKLRDDIRNVAGSHKEVYKKIDVNNFTFGHLRTLIDAGLPYKHLHLYAFCIEGTLAEVVMNSEDKQWDNVRIADAIRASMSIPGLFKPHIINDKKYVDGGLLLNMPIKRFDKVRYLNRFLKGDDDYEVFNEETIGFRLISEANQTVHDVSKVNGSMDLLIALMKAFYDAEAIIAQAEDKYRYRCIAIPDCGVGLLDFDLDEAKKQTLLKAGSESTETYFSHYETQIKERKTSEVKSVKEEGNDDQPALIQPLATPGF